MSVKLFFTKVRAAHGVAEYRLHNGLRVLHRQERSAPVVAVCVTYHVGSRNESKGRTGATHILEHLLFKDTKNFKKESGKAMSNYLEWFGANWNGTTWLDRTNYFEVLPREHVQESLAVQADRMRYAEFTQADLDSEMTVVRNEYERSRNDPFSLLDEEMMAKAFVKHPYRIPTIGTKEDIENATAETMREFYNIFYWPNNATLTVFGDISSAQLTALVMKYFGPLPASPHRIPVLKVKEPAQTKPRSVSLSRNMGANIVALSYKIPDGRHRDFPALVALATIAGQGFSSQLRNELVDTGLAVSVTPYVFRLHDPGLMTFVAQVSAGASPKAVLSRMRSTLEALAKEGPKETELARAKEILLAEKSQEHDGVFSEMRSVSEAVAAGDWRLAYQADTEIEKLKLSAIARAAKKYLTKKTETSGTLVEKK